MISELGCPPGIQLLGMEDHTPPDDLGDLQWEVEPPAYIWLPYREVKPIKGQDMPEIGKVFYTGWRGPRPPLDKHDYSDLSRELIPQFVDFVRHFDLVRRISG